jgi:hypothetical protein
MEAGSKAMHSNVAQHLNHSERTMALQLRKGFFVHVCRPADSKNPTTLPEGRAYTTSRTSGTAGAGHPRLWKTVSSSLRIIGVRSQNQLKLISFGSDGGHLTPRFVPCIKSTNHAVVAKCRLTTRWV